MELSAPWLAATAALVLVVAFLYSSVGHGGASGYLAVLSLFGLPPKALTTTVLLLNVLVAGTAALFFTRAGHFSFRLLWPFLAMSLPSAFLGGFLDLSPRVYAVLLAFVLVLAALRLLLVLDSGYSGSKTRTPPLALALPAGGGIGFLSGIVGVGGGIFLSPLLILLRWADPKGTAAVSAFFIVANSASGLIGRAAGGQLELGQMALLIPAAFAGGLAGSYLGARHFSGPLLRRLLGVVLLVASAKLLWTEL